jgi:ribonuclease HI
MPATERPDYLLFTDGACSGNPGKGGWAFILRDAATDEEVIESDAERHTTNNRMELLSVINGLKRLPLQRQRVRLVTDSQYVTKGISEWMEGWKARGWKRKVGKKLEPVANEELWRELDVLVARHDVDPQWVRGHAGHAENEECDRRAVEAIKLLD